MKHFRFARLLPWLVISLCPPLLGHCGGALEHVGRDRPAAVLLVDVHHGRISDAGPADRRARVSPGANCTGGRHGFRRMVSGGGDAAAAAGALVRSTAVRSDLRVSGHHAISGDRALAMAEPARAGRGPINANITCRCARLRNSDWPDGLAGNCRLISLPGAAFYGPIRDEIAKAEKELELAQ